MNKRHGLFIGFAVLLLAVMFMAAGCGNPTGGGTNSGGGGGGGGSIVGQWKYKSSNANYTFVLDFTSNKLSASGSENGTPIESPVFDYTYVNTTLTISFGSQSAKGIAVINGDTLKITGFTGENDSVNGEYTRQKP
jgi:hypothetical protein